MVWHPDGTPFNPEADLPEDWAARPELMTDLNQPVSGLHGTLSYPILDPAATATGFSVAPASRPAPSVRHPLPMPVRWLYVLKNGQLTLPESSGGGIAHWTPGNPNSPSRENPITGRIAFWTDDETTKININTASGDEWSPQDGPEVPGAYWDVPRTQTVFDKLVLANHQPSKGEFQRYPGHPATTYLTAVFPQLSRAQLAQISPGVQFGGSRGGTQIASGALVADTHRLYASVDELAFDPQRKSQTGLSPQAVSRNRFFLTSSSKAPEVNLFDRPRVAMWPVHQETGLDYRSGFDHLITFCASVNSYPYYFTRRDSYHTTRDLAEAPRNVAIMEYLRRLTSAPVPGFGGSFNDKYPQDRDQILVQIIDYIRCTNLADDSMEEAGNPTYTQPLAAVRTTAARSAEPASAMDVGHGQVAPLRSGDAMGFGRFYTISEAGLHFICTADAAFPPSNQVKNAPLAGQFKNHTLEKPLAPGEKRVEALLLLELFSPSQGWTRLRPDMRIRIRGLDQFSVNGVPLGFPGDGTLVQTLPSGAVFHGRSWGGVGGFRMLLRDRRLPARGPLPADEGLTTENVYPFVSVPVTISSDGGVMQFKGGEITVEIHAGTSAPFPLKSRASAANTLVQTIKIKFEDSTFPVPALVRSGTPALHSNDGPVAPFTAREAWWTFSRDGALRGLPPALAASRMGRTAYAADTASNGQPRQYILGAGSFLRHEDVVRTMIPFHGDYRHVAATHEVPASVFVPHHRYHLATEPLAHALSSPSGPSINVGADLEGRLVPDTTYQVNRAPDVPPGVVESGLSGDWDTGVSVTLDGPYINKPDEGNNFRGDGSAIPYFDNGAHESGGASLFSPNRQVSSPVMFGSLPNQIKAGVPWRTLLFRPAPPTGHIGAASPPDHLLLDLFWMPAVEPYAISEPLATAGKINLNHEIVPFRHITRTTALQAVLKGERVIAIPTADGQIYKGAGLQEGRYRHEIDAPETLRQFQERFAQHRLFLSPSEICELYLVPAGKKLEDMEAYWAGHQLTGDNCRERPYSGLYPRLTTRSNTYTVHYKVQVLRQRRSSRQAGTDAVGRWATWQEGRDEIAAEERGSTLLERYISPTNAALPDFATLPVTPETGLASHYRFRVLQSRRFAP
jgi:hypothetical protein